MVPKKKPPEQPAGEAPSKAETPPVPAEPAAVPEAPASPPPEPRTLADEAEEFCASLEQFFRRTFKELPSASDLAEIHAQQAAARDLVQRAEAGSAEAGEALSKVTLEHEEQRDALARSRADFLNYQTRAQNDLKRAEESALRGYMADLLPILDSLDLAAAEADRVHPQAEIERTIETAGTEDMDDVMASANRVADAVRMIRDSFVQALKVRGLERIDVNGKPYDPALHEAVAVRPADPAKGEQPNQVVEQLRPGYLWKGLLLRPAQVLLTPPPEKKKG
jgi:molecular chaperone GrpE